MIKLITLLVSLSASSAFGVKVLKYSEDGSPVNFDPVQSSTIYSNKVVTAVYDTLYEYKYLKIPFELKPRLASALPKVSKDGLVYTITLKKGVEFIDDPCFKGGKGREVVAEDVVYSLKRHFDPKNRSMGAWLWTGKIKGVEKWKKSGAKYNSVLEGIKSIDRYTLQITLNEPFPQLIYTLEMGFSGVVAQEAVKKYGRELAIKPVGSGPYMLKSHNSKKTILLKNPKYRKEFFNVKAEGYDPKKHGATGIAKLDGKRIPIVDRVEISWMKELVSRWNSFTKGNEIVWTVLQNNQLDEVLASKDPVKLKPAFAKKYNFRVAEEAGLVYNHFNMANRKLGYHPDPKQNEKNTALRCAIRKAIDWPSRINKFYLGIGKPYPGFVPPGVDGFDPNMDKSSVTRDVTGAKKLLAENGWNKKNLPKIVYPGVSSVRTRQFFESFRGNLADIGYPKNKIKFKGYATFGDFTKAVKNRKTMLVPMAWGLDYPDAQNTLALFYGPNASPGSNMSNYEDEAYDKLFEKVSVMQPGPERTKLYKQLNQMIVKDCPTISSFSRTRIFLWHKQAVMWPQRDIVSNVFKYTDVL